MFIQDENMFKKFEYKSCFVLDPHAESDIFFVGSVEGSFCRKT